MGEFKGFRPELLEFLRQLGANNTREWFQAHRATYEAFYVQPARELVVALGERLHQFGPDVHAEPKVFGSILTINRDVRFARDKVPYKTHLDLWFWQGEGPSRECPGYFLRITPEALMLGAGMHSFPAAALQAYRNALADPQRGMQLEAIAAGLDGFTLGGRTLKRGPDWLRHTGLFAEKSMPLPPELYTPELPDWCMQQFAHVRSLQQWLVETLRA